MALARAGEAARYPGDYELMKGIYGYGRYAGFTGETLFAKAVNLFILGGASSAVVERKNIVRRCLAELVATSKPRGRPIRILSIAAGPAQETFELLGFLDDVPHPIEIVLFDQDKDAFAFAHHRLTPVVATRWAERVRIVYRHDTIKRLLRDPQLFAPLGEFDTIFSCGLFDYLPQATAVALTASLYANLSPGGRPYIGNQTPRTASRWAMEFFCDWYLIFREHADMLDFATAAAPTAKVSIEEEPTGANPLVVLERAP